MDGRQPQSGHRPGEGWREGPGGPGDGTCWRLPDVPAGELTGSQAATLASLAEQQKLAQDLSAAFAEQYGAQIFERVAAAESRQLEAVRTVLERYQLADPTGGLAAGEFASPAGQARYDQLLADGSAGLAAALAAGQTLAQEQLTELETALDGTGPPELTMVYEHLLGATQRQLAAFEAWSES
jgi:hypothetical protein